MKISLSGYYALRNKFELIQQSHYYRDRGAHLLGVACSCAVSYVSFRRELLSAIWRKNIACPRVPELATPPAIVVEAGSGAESGALVCSCRRRVITLARHP